ncbi:MAG: universal stress protein [Nitrospira sp.]
MVTVMHAVPHLRYLAKTEEGRPLLQRYSAKLAKSGFQIREVVRTGKPADEILTVAKQQKADLIVTGAKGVGTIRRVLLGSVSTRVIQHAHCGVLVVR